MPGPNTRPNTALLSAILDGGGDARPAPSFGRRAADFLGLGDDIDAGMGAAQSVDDWLQRHRAARQAALSPEQRTRQEQMRQQLADMEAQGQRDLQDRRDAIAAPVQRLVHSAPVQRFTQLLGDTYRDWSTPDPQVSATADVVRRHLTKQSDAIRAAIPPGPFHAPLDAIVGAQQDWAPNFAMDTAVDATTPVGAASNLDLPIGQLAHAGGAAAHLAGLPAFVPGMRRPGLNKTSRAAVEEARRYLQHASLTGPVPRAELESVLKEAPLWMHSHRVTKDLPVEPALGEARRILTPSASGVGHDFAPEATRRLHGMADIGAALPFQANWGNAIDPEMLPAFNHDRDAAELFGRFFSAMSPRTSVPKNSLEALGPWRDYLTSPGRKPTDARLRELGAGNVRSKTDNLIRAILGDDPSGEKVDLFTDYMAGHATLPVPDVHGLYAIGSQHGSIDSVIPELRQILQQDEGIPAVRGGLSKKDYVRRLVDSFGRSLQSYDPQKPMGPLFGSTWEGTRAQKGLGPQGGMIDIYRSRGLTEPGALLDPNQIERAIREWHIK